MKQLSTYTYIYQKKYVWFPIFTIYIEHTPTHSSTDVLPTLVTMGRSAPTPLYVTAIVL